MSARRTPIHAQMPGFWRKIGMPRRGTKTMLSPVRKPALVAVVSSRPAVCRAYPVYRATPRAAPQPISGQVKARHLPKSSITSASAMAANVKRSARKRKVGTCAILSFTNTNVLPQISATRMSAPSANSCRFRLTGERGGIGQLYLTITGNV